MTVTCEGCKARFKFDETRIKPQGIKVHCSKCRHTFVLKPAVQTGEPPVIRTGPIEEPRAPADAPRSALAGEVSRILEPPGVGLDDPLADVPGFEPENRPLPSPEEEEKKALAGLRKDEILDASVEEALERFQATKEDDAAETTGSTSGFDNFDWDQVSFTGDERAPAAEDGPPAASDEPEIAVEADVPSDDEEEIADFTPEEVAPAEARRGPPPPGEAEGKDMELDLSHLAPKREVTLAGAEASASVEPRPAAPEISRAPQGRISARLRVARPLVQAFRTRTGQPRVRLALPRFPTIIASAVLAIVAATAGALVAYGPFSGNALEARPSGAGNQSIVLAIEDARGVMVEPLNGHARYVVTGKARWENAPGAVYFLEGVITGPEGEVLERRPARLGETPDWKVIEEVDPDLFAAKESIPGEGEIPFTVLFTPEPSWRGDVHFELSSSP